MKTKKGKRKKKAKPPTGAGLFAGTFLEEIKNLAESGQIELRGPEPIKKGEEIVGELTKFEQACFALKLKKGETDLSQIKEKALAEAEKPNAERGKILEQLMGKLHDLKAYLNLIQELADFLVRVRLNLPADLAIRAGNKIVRIGKLHPNLRVSRGKPFSPFNSAELHKDAGVFSGTFFDEVCAIVENGQFKMKLEPVEKGEEVIGELTALEKALFTLIEQKADLVDAYCDGCLHKSVYHEECAEFDLIELVAKEVNLVHDIVVRLVKERLALQADFNVREGYKIIKVEERLRLPDVMILRVTGF